MTCNFNEYDYTYHLDTSGIYLKRHDNIIYLDGALKLWKINNITEKEIFNIKTPLNFDIDNFEKDIFDFRPFGGEYIEVLLYKYNKINDWFLHKVFKVYNRHVYKFDIFYEVQKSKLWNIGFVYDIEEAIRSGETVNLVKKNYIFIPEYTQLYNSDEIVVDDKTGYYIKFTDFVNIKFNLLHTSQIKWIYDNYVSDDYFCLLPNIFPKKTQKKFKNNIEWDEIDKLNILNNFLKYRIYANCKH